MPRPEPDRFADRADAGLQLGGLLGEYAGRSDVLVLGLARGGLPVAASVAGKLRASLDVLVVRKVGVPWREELAMGAIASGGVQVINQDVVANLGLSPASIDAAVEKQRRVLEEREHLYRQGRPPQPIAGRTVIVVDDGLATGASMRAAVLALRQLAPAEVIVAVPVAPAATLNSLDEIADRVVCVHIPNAFYAVGAWYESFPQVSDGEVRVELGL